MSGYGLTPRQRDALAFIAQENGAGRFPSPFAVGQALGCTGRGNGKQLVDGLMERGRVARFLCWSDLQAGCGGGILAVPEARLVQRGSS